MLLGAVLGFLVSDDQLNCTMSVALAVPAIYQRNVCSLRSWQVLHSELFGACCQTRS
jgi:hypothetical protein